VAAAPRPGFEPDAGILGQATIVLASLVHLEPDVVSGVLDGA